MYYNKRKLIISIMWIVVGIVLLVLEFAGILDQPVYSGMGGGFLGVGLMQTVRNVRYHSDEAYKEKIDIAGQDERNRYLRMKAWSWAGYLFVLGAGVISVVLMVTGKMQQGQIISYCLCAVLVLYWIAYMVLQRKY